MGEETGNRLSQLRERHRLVVLDALRQKGTASRADLARATGLSRTTISNVVQDLVDAALVDERADVVPGRRTGGRPGVLLALSSTAGAALAIDFGHTHIRVAVADLASNILAEAEVAHDVDGSAHGSLDAAAELAERVLTQAGVAWEGVLGAAMGLPGPIDRATGVVGSSVILPDWAGLTPAAEMERRVGVSVTVDNDANLAAVGEARFGAGRGASDLVFLKVSSGIGGGLLFGGRLHRGVTGSAGEFGHVLVDPEGPVCRCGNRGCLETVAGSRVLVELLRHSYGADLTVRDMVEAAARGDVGCRRVLVDAGRAVGRALADLCNTINPERVVIGGDLGGAGAPLVDGVKESLERYALPAAMQALTVVGGELGARAEVLGALSLVIGDTEHLSSAHLGAARAT